MAKPFSKRVRAWDEEVFAGLSILVLITLVLVAWWGLDKRSQTQMQNANSASTFERR
jgi:hypothetical protein